MAAYLGERHAAMVRPPRPDCAIPRDLDLLQLAAFCLGVRATPVTEIRHD
jgi:hypothetical protein